MNITSEELLKEARALEPQLQQWRRTLHRHPEVGFDLPHTKELVKKALTEMGYEPNLFYFTFDLFLNNFSELFSVSCLLVLWKSCAVSCLECFKSLINNFLISLICILLCIILIHCIKFFWLTHGQRISELLVQLT